MHKRFLQLLSLVIFCLVILTKPSTSHASELIGTHLGEGDVGFQASIIESILIPNGLEPGSPVTVMVPATMLQEAQQHNTVEALAAAVNSGGFFPIVRINGVCNGTSAAASAETVASAKAIFGDNALIVWGNEVNNQDTECDDWQSYIDGYSNIQGQPNVSPAALDYYMGNPNYTVAKMEADFPAMKAIFNTSPRVGNAYGCVSVNVDACDPFATTTQQRGYAEIGVPFYLTEFSLSPEGGSSDAPDTSIPKVLEFLENRAGETGAQKITPLVRNVCNDESDWLLYVNGQLFTPLGTNVSENCEGSTSALNAYDLSKYPAYEIINELFFLTPIRNLIDGGSTERTVAKLRTEFASSGYEAYCASEGVEIKPMYNTEALIETFLFQNPEGVYVEKNLTTDSVEKVDFTNAKYPIWRDVSDKKFLMSSLEEYFGFKDVYEENASKSEITTAAINSLLSEKQMCVQGWKALVAQQLTCERLAVDDECALLARTIPGTDYNVSQALALLSKYDPSYREGTENRGCSDLTASAGTRTDLEIIAEAEANTLKTVLTNTPTYFDRAYRYGFIVAAIETKPPEKDSESKAKKIFNFFTTPTEDKSPKHEVLVTAFKIPDIGTNKGGGDDSGSQFWDDPLSLTRKVLNTYDNNKNIEDNLRPAKRREIEQAAAAASTQNEGRRIFCSEGEFPDLDGTVSCKNEVTKALTDIINGSAQGCGPTEAANVITDIAGFGDPEDEYGKIFDSDNGGQVLIELFGGGDFPDPTHDKGGVFDPQASKTDDPAERLTSIFTINEDTWENKTGSTKVDFYLVYPKGFEITQIEEALQGTFFTHEQIANIKSNPSIVDGFAMTGTQMGLNGGSVGWTFTNLEKTAAGECGFPDDPTGSCRESCIANGISPIECAQLPDCPPNNCTENVSINIEQDGAGVGILGGRLGWLMRKIQVSLSSNLSFAYDYFESCKTTEEFLLGRCNAFGRTIGNSITSNPNQSSTSIEDLYCVNWIGLSPSEIDTYKQNMSNYLKSVSYSNTNSLSAEHLEKFGDDLQNQTHVDWNDNQIAYDETNFFENSNIGGRALLWTKHPSCGGQVCFDYIMDTCGDRGVNPAICIGMSITESGGLNHLRFPELYDFGCLSTEPPNNISAGLSCLTDKFFYSNTPRNGVYIKDMHFNDMWLQFAGKNFESDSYGNLESFLAKASKLGDVGYSTEACVGQIDPNPPVDSCFPGIHSCQNEDYSRNCRDDGSWETPDFCTAGCDETTGQCAEIPLPPPTVQPEGIFCRGLCTYNGNGPLICNRLPACPDDTIYETYCRELCIANGSPISTCSSLPVCEPRIGSELYCRELCISAGNQVLECAGLPACNP